MRLVTYLSDTGPTAGLLVGQRVCPTTALPISALDSANVRSVRELLATTNPDRRRALADTAVGIVEKDPDRFPDIDELALLPPVPDPQKILCLALNSRAHCREANIPEPSVPWFFPKWQTSLAGHHAEIHPPTVTQKFDWEGEVAIVIGSKTRNVSEADARNHIAGVMPFNDLSARDLMHGLETIALTKSGDGQAPCGPALVTMDEIADLDDLRYRTRVNGETKQDGSTSDQVFSAARTLAMLSRTTTLLPGDIVAMGTLLGVGLFQSPPQFLCYGDVVEVEIDHVGVLTTTIGAPSDDITVGPTAGQPSRSTTRQTNV